MNTFGYVGGNPAIYVDPQGTNPVAAVAWCASNPGCAAGVLGITAYVIGKNNENHGGSLPTPDPLEMAKGGRQNKDNEYSREANMMPDPCGWLKQQYKQASSSAEKMKIKTAQKVLGCRQNSTLDDKCER
ncbi:hypothetical protein [Parachitinimonas caeni]|uniref:RHS repeat-associated core domain-containing protein n=1 Tax=Parachitinimonas caeni TaxID=3031301 RepID=A0ABT7DZ25_9NEIS|nr:hypothetical protein [Parachitinimonas caeni]MDK2125312.1 hypothetical protein [Parachitinimonas caeni]